MSFAVSDSFLTRFMVALLLALAMLQGALAVAVLTEPGRRAREYTLPVPHQLASIVSVLETVPAEHQARVAEALNSPTLVVRLHDELPATTGGLRASGLMETIFKQYSEALRDHEFRIDTRPILGGQRWLRQADGGDVLSRSAVRIIVALKTGKAVEIAPSRGARLTRFAGRLSGFAALASLLLVVALMFAIRETRKPVARLASSARAFAGDLSAPDLPVTGPRDLRDMALAFNGMKGTIRQLVAERTQMLAAIAHDLRTYLTRMRLRSDFIDDPEQRERMERDLDAMANLLQDTLVLSRESSVREGPQANCDAAQVIADVCRGFRDAGAALEVAGALPGSARVRMSEPALRRLASNLIENALTYGVRVRVSVACEDQRVVLMFDDDGPGIPESEIPRLLRPFERLEASRGRETGGSGLGLAIVQALVTQTGGTLQLANRAGGGLTCKVSLPQIA